MWCVYSSVSASPPLGCLLQRAHPPYCALRGGLCPIATPIQPPPSYTDGRPQLEEPRHRPASRAGRDSRHADEAVSAGTNREAAAALQNRVGRDDQVGARVTAVGPGDQPTGLGHDEPAGGQVPGVEAALVEGVRAPVGDEAQVRGGAAQSPDVTDRGSTPASTWACSVRTLAGTRSRSRPGPGPGRARRHGDWPDRPRSALEAAQPAPPPRWADHTSPWPGAHTAPATGRQPDACGLPSTAATETAYRGNA